MSDQPLVSVIMPFFNTAPEFMQEAVESLLAQSYSNWEALLVDDGSTNESTKLALGYATQFPDKIRYLEHTHHANRGISVSRLVGIEAARGVYLTLLDSDDRWLPHKLEQQVVIMENNPIVAMVYGISLYWYSWNSDNHHSDFKPDLGIKPDTIIQPPELLICFLKGRAAIPCTNSIMLRRSILEKTGSFEERFTGMYEDQVFYAKVSLNAPIYVTDTCWDWYRQNSASVTASAANAGKTHHFHYAYLQWLAHYLTERGCHHTELWQTLRQELWLYAYPAWLANSPNAINRLRWIKKWFLRIVPMIILERFVTKAR